MIVMHIDANSAYLSWSAAAMLERGYPIDIRTIPAAVGGTQATRHGIILAKSMPAKKFGIKTGESLYEAKKKCPEIFIVHPDYDLYMLCSNAMYNILSEYSPIIQRYSVDECFMDYKGPGANIEDALQIAHLIKARINKELGFTVNIGVSCNKLLAKMASEMEKPDKVHTLFLDEIEEKLWPLPIGELFMVGQATAKKLLAINVRTIGELAKMDRTQVKSMLKSHGELIWNYANGVDSSPVLPNSRIVQKGIGNSMTVHYDVTDKKDAYIYILSLTERVSGRVRSIGCLASLVWIWIKTDEFICYRHQVQLSSYTDLTSNIYKVACNLFDECWEGQPIRQLGVGVSNLTYNDQFQLSWFDEKDMQQHRCIDASVDLIRKRYGDSAIMRGVFTNSSFKSMEGGVNEGNFLTMGGYGI